ncbi:MAG: UDP-N-acetylglucosamine 1-carboxyvinyltransferase [Anaerolineales bacterium]|nr:UDP-N-acetylglucosamine 1-carboxyvinyltransferase [Anaerolineales bacterium]
MPAFLIEGGYPLKGEVTPSGNKNAALPLLAACLLTDEPVVLHNVPQIGDVQVMRQLLETMGVKIDDLKPNTWRVHAEEIRDCDLDPDLARQIRASVLLAGPMLGRKGGVDLPPPGGDVIGRRRVDTHLMALKRLGAEVKYGEKEFSMRAPNGLSGTKILLDEASVTATENAIMAAVFAQGESMILNAASEPHVQELCVFLNQMGANIENIGSNSLKISGVEKLHGGEHTIGPDYLEVMSLIGAAVITGGEITIRDAAPEYLAMARLVFNKLGVDWEIDGHDIFVPTDQKMKVEFDIGEKIPQISVMPWPAFPTDLMSIAIVVATQCNGTVLFHDWMYETRMFFIDKLVSMGANIILCDPHRSIVQGPSQLFGEPLESPDIRAGLALTLAALSAEGTSRIRNINQIDRGYERIDEKLQSLGAHIQRQEDE